MILENPKHAEGYTIRWCRWSEDQSFVVTSVTPGSGSRQIKGTLHDIDGAHKYRSYNLVKGITTGELINDYWYIVNWVDFRLEDGLFEI